MEQKRIKIYLVHEQVEWHNSDTETDVFAYYKQEDAQAKALKLIGEFKAWCDKDDREIVFEHTGAKGTTIETISDDIYNVWIDTAMLH